MERLSGRAPMLWSVVTVRGTIDETARARTLLLDVTGWPGHLAGQHLDVRLTDEDGYQAERSYSIASAPETEGLALTVELIEDGEVSPYFVEEVRAGDQFEARGPIGTYFTWDVRDGGPLLLLAGGSGLVPLMAMLRHRDAKRSAIETRLLVSSRRLEDLLYRDELDRLSGTDGLEIHRTLTRGAPEKWTEFTGRINAAMIESVAPAPSERPRIFVCGPTAFVERAADLLVELGHDPAAVHTERFGPTGP